MKAFARLTAVVFILAGLAAVVSGAYLFPRELVNPEPAQPAPASEPGLFGGLFEMPDLSTITAPLLFPLRLLVAGTLALQGLIVIAAGEALWLLANIAGRNEQTSQHLATLAARASMMTIP